MSLLESPVRRSLRPLTKVSYKETPNSSAMRVLVKTQSRSNGDTSPKYRGILQPRVDTVSVVEHSELRMTRCVPAIYLSSIT